MIIIDAVFTKLSLHYGQDFLRRWEGIPLSEVKADWEHELACFKDRPEAIAYALKHLPADKPPTVTAFRQIAQQCPPDEHHALPVPKADQDKARAVLQGLLAKLSQNKKMAE